MEIVYAFFTISLLTRFCSSEITGCPDKCSCVESIGVSELHELTVNCHNTSDVDPEKLSEQLDSLLSSNLTYGRLTSLSIVNSPLTHVPQSVCRLTTLKQLNVDDNRLVELPKDCFGNLTELTTLSAASNTITELRDGIFHRLAKISSLNFSKNRINSIGLQVFPDSSHLTHLRYIDLGYNELVSLEPWPYYRGLLGTKDSRVVVNLNKNRLTEFTNRMKVNFTCGGGVIYMRVDLSYNRIRHITDIQRGWNVGKSLMLCMLHTEHGHPTLKVDVKAKSFACDCMDFEVMKYTFRYPFFDVFKSSHCNSTEQEIYDKMVNSVPLALLVCELLENCPSTCRCVYRPWNATLHVHCSNANLVVLPAELPALPKSYTKYKLDFSNNPLRTLGHRDYFNATSSLDISNCRIETITIDVWEALVRIPKVYVDRNLLVTLPSSVVGVDITTEELSLSENPWRCSCGDKWMSGWLKSINNSLTNTKDILCFSPSRLRGMNIQQIGEDTFCINPVTRAIAISVSTVLGGTAILMFSVTIVYRLRIQMYAIFKIHPFDRDECDEEDMDYDVFLCYSLKENEETREKDDEKKGKDIIRKLRERNFRVCAEDEWAFGSRFSSNIPESVARSKRTVCLLNENFIKSHDETSGYCTTELYEALQHWLVDNRKTKRLVILVASEDPDFFSTEDPIMEQLRWYRNQYTYIDFTAGDWFDRLLYALPVSGINVPPEDEDLIAPAQQRLLPADA